MLAVMLSSAPSRLRWTPAIAISTRPRCTETRPRSGRRSATIATPREQIFVTTKVWSSELANGRLQKSAEASLQRLQMDQVDLLLIHWPSRSVPFREQVLALCDAKRRGLARHVGVSNFTPEVSGGSGGDCQRADGH